MPLTPGRFLLPSGVNLDKVRLYHALREAGLQPLLRGDERSALLRLSCIVKLEAGVGPLLPGIKIEHGRPRVTVGRIWRPYIFPQALVQLCRNQWAERRDLRASFRGLMTESRERTLAPWQGVDGVRITGTDRGRQESTKYWDVEYFTELGQSQCVLSPDGNFPFAYRTYEAALCGALPIVETKHECYGDLHVVGFDEVSPDALPEWSEELALRNAEIATKLMTVPEDELRAEVFRLGGWDSAR